MSDDGSKTIPGWVWTLVQTLVATALVGGYIQVGEIQADLIMIKSDSDVIKKDLATLEGKFAEADARDREIATSLAAIQAELPFIKKGVDDLGLLLRSR
jgi:hypothetical protein